MRHFPRHTVLFALSLLLLSLPGSGLAQITTPEKEFGFPVGADYELATYTQLHGYWERLAGESERMVLDTIGLTAEGRPQLMAIITSPENHQRLDHYRNIARRLALAEGVSEEEARALSQEGKAVVWIDGGLHASEVVGAQQILELVYRLTSAEDPETLRFLDDLIILAVTANPDGMELVSNWYYRNDGNGSAREDRSYGGLPVLYHKYAGHDNNRDFYMSNLPETTNMLRVQYREWFPQIIYNHHQTGPQGSIIFAPPFRNPPNHFLDPLIMTTIEQVGTAMHHRFVQEGKGGSAMRGGASYSIWWNGGLRTTPYFHNSIGLLTEIRGGPNPEEIPFVPLRQLASTDIPLPVQPGVLHFNTAIEYSMTANWAVMDYASRNRDVVLFNLWRMGMNSIEKGSKDSWTVKPTDLYAAAEEFGGMNASGTRDDYTRFLNAPEKRDPRGFIIPSDQADFPTAVAFANALIKNGVQVKRATESFTVGGKSYPAGSLVVMGAQAYRPHVLDMFEPQDHPNDFAYPGGPPIPPYDATGWTLAFQMGVEFDRILDGFDGPFQAVGDLMPPPAATVTGSGTGGYLFSHEVNASFAVVNRLQAQGQEVIWLREAFSAGGVDYPAGTFFVPDAPGVRGRLETLTHQLGVGFTAVDRGPRVEALQLQKPRIGLFDQYGGNTPSGWIRFVLEQFDYDFQLVFPQELDQGGLADKFDVIILPDGSVPSVTPSRGGRGYRGGGATDPQMIPVQYRDRLGSVTPDKTIPSLKAFLEAGGTIITLEGATQLGFHLGLPVSDYLVDDDGTPLQSEEFFVPGSLLEVSAKEASPVLAGMADRYIVNFARSPVFSVAPGAPGLKVLAEYADDRPLRSGWAWGQEKLKGGAALVEARVGSGTLYLFGPQLTFRGQTHVTFPLIFNGILLGAAQETNLR